MKLKSGKFKEWNQKMKYCRINSYYLSKSDIAYVILPPSTSIMKVPIGSPWSGAT